MSEEMYLLRLRGVLLGTLMARNVYKSNVTWASYPFLPPTGASGFLASLLQGERWYESNHLEARRLHRLPCWEGMWALGAYPLLGNASKLHYRSHLGSDEFNYEATIWRAGPNVGKKLATVVEYLTDDLEFLVISPQAEKLELLQQHASGRLAPIGKKGCIQLSYDNHLASIHLTHANATGEESVLGIIPAEETGQMKLDATVPYFVPVSSEQTQGKKGKLEWRCIHCLWSNTQTGLQFRKGVQVYRTDDARYAISGSLLAMIRG